MLAMSSTFAGNLAITGSVANIIVVEKARTVTHQLFRVHEDWRARYYRNPCCGIVVVGIRALLNRAA